MIRPLIAIILLTFLVSCNKKKSVTGLVSDGLKGDAKIITETTYYIKWKGSGEAEKTQIEKKEIWEYSRRGYLIRDFKYMQDNEPDIFDSIFYDENNKRIEKRRCVRGVENYKMVYKYEDNLSRYELIAYDKNGKVDAHALYNIDKAGNIISDSIYNTGSDTLDEFRVYQYDLAGNKIQENDFDGKGKLRQIETNKYDSLNRVIEEKTHYYDSNLCTTWQVYPDSVNHKDNS